MAVGLGGQGEVCGAVSGGVLAMGLLFESEALVHPKTRAFVHQFVEQNGALRCSELLGVNESSSEVLLANAQDRKQEVCEGLVRGVVHYLVNQLETMK